jgi:hypothetical protein
MLLEQIHYPVKGNNNDIVLFIALGLTALTIIYFANEPEMPQRQVIINTNQEKS